MEGKLPASRRLKPVGCGSADSPGACGGAAAARSSRVPPSRSLLSSCHRVRSGRKCLLNQCVRWWGRVRPGGLSTPGICAQIPDGISSPQSMPRPWASLHPRPGQGGDTLLLSGGPERSPLSGPHWK